MRKFILYFACLFLLTPQVYAQKPKTYDAARIKLMLEKLDVLGNVLYVAAHPDDENTRLIAYMANGAKVNAGYFACTRGDGGQNLLGPEIRELLGVIRTQELLAARRIDGGHQFFSRAVDFGYSKNPDETFNIWDKQEVLSDLVWVIREFRPDVVITRFNKIPGTTHGHHTASAILASLAFAQAGDASKFPEQLKYVKPWSPKSLYWNTYFWSRSAYQKDTSELIKINVGQYNALLGKSYTEIAGDSRSMHKSQGFGASESRGTAYDYMQLEAGVKGKQSIFDPVDISWGRVEGGKAIEPMVKNVISQFDMDNPSTSVPALLEIRKKVAALKNDFWREKKLDEIDQIIYASLGLFFEPVASDYSACPGEQLKISFETINRSQVPIKLNHVSISSVKKDSTLNINLTYNQDSNFSMLVKVPENMPYSQPYWLRKPATLGMFTVDDQQEIGKPENDPALEASFSVTVAGQEINFKKPVIYKRTDPVKGEIYRPFVISPPVYANLDEKVYIFSDDQAKDVVVKVKAGSDNVDGKLSLTLPADWQVQPNAYDFTIDAKGAENSFTFHVKPPPTQESVEGLATVQIGDKKYQYSLVEINYAHIPAQMLFPASDSKFVNLDIRKTGNNIGYLMGAGDDVPASLRQIGYHVDLINDMEFTPDNLDKFDAIILGVRAYNTVERLRYDNDKLLQYTERGGTLIVQYNNSYRLVNEHFAPFDLHLSHDRVTVEQAEVQILQPDHQVVNYPNKITSRDFEGWVQERGLYFPDQWSDQYTPIFSCHDPGEEPLKGALLVAKYGKGYYAYTGFSFFRELPAGVPGAYRLFANLIALGKDHRNQ